MKSKITKKNLDSLVDSALKGSEATAYITIGFREVKYNKKKFKKVELLEVSIIPVRTGKPKAIPTLKVHHKK